MPTTNAGRRDGLQSSELVYRSLKEQIVAGSLAPDTRLIALAIAAEFGVSRTPVHEALKRLAAGLAAHRITPSELGRLRVIVDSMAEAVDAGKREQVIVANMLFHDVIYGAAGNGMLERLGRDLREPVRRFTTLPFASGHRVNHVLEEHRAIVAALESHDPVAAEAASRAHLSAAREYVVRMQLQEFAEKALG